MKNRKSLRKLIGILTVITVAGFGSLALAQSTTGTPYNQGMQDRQMGSGGQGMHGRQMGSGGQGWGHRGSNWNDWSRGGQGNMGNMSAEDMQKMQKERDAFLKDTEGLRQDLYNKDLELRNELGKQNRDERKVANLQKEISQLETQFYQKRDEHMIKMQKINPNAGRGYMQGGGMMKSGGQGMQGRQMGSGGQGWGQRASNWNDWSRGGQGNMGNMSAEDMQRMQQERDAFLMETEGLRQDLYNKDLELRNELDKQDPNDRKVANLQNEISQLETQFYRKRDEHMVKMQKINPNMGRGYMRGGGMMGPRGGRGMMGPGSGQNMMGTGGNNRW